MAKDLLSDLKCKRAKARGALWYLNDGDGLRLQIRPDGARYWMLRYHFDGRESTNGLGPYPSVGLAEARARADVARQVVAAGGHPTQARKVRRATRTEASKATFQAIAEQWLERNRRDWSAHHLERNRGLLKRILFPTLGPLPVSEITEAILLDTVLKAYDAGIRESARRARAVAAQVFRFAKDTKRATHNPALELARSGLLKRPPVRHFAALKSDQVGPMLRALTASGTEPVTRAALLLMLYTGMRDAALRGAHWSEFDLKAATWTVPAARMKSGREHRLALPTQAVEILQHLAKQTNAKPSAFVFASNNKAGFLAENTLRAVLHRLGFKVTAHGLRSLITDLLNERGFNPDWIERQLDHVQKDQVRAAYLHTDFFDQRRPMMQWLADWADAQRKETDAPPLPANVHELRRVA